MAALIPLGFTLSVAAFDWLMSLTPTWYSTTFGIYFFAGCFLAGLALVTLLASLAQSRAQLPQLQPSHYHALGRLMLAFTAFWAYIAYFQFMLIWIANRPVEGAWFLARSSATWRGTSVALAVGQFAVPFVVLLSYRLKGSRHFLAGLAVWILAFHYLDVYWMVMPAYSPLSFRVSWVDGAALLAVACSSAAYAWMLVRDRPLVSVGDPRLEKAFDYHSR